MAETDPNSLTLADLARRVVEHPSTERLLQAAREEDLGDRGDVTSRSIIREGATTRTVLRSREPGVVAGLAVIPAVLDVFRARARFVARAADGDRCDRGDVLGEFEGSTRDILTVERTVLNLVGQLSGVATATRGYVDLVTGTRAAVCETRKTVPGMRALQKYAVRCGGGQLHRLGLHDAALFKDNHLAALPRGPLDQTLVPALDRVRESGDLRFVMVEVDTLEQFEELLRIDADLLDIVLLDNMPPKTLQQAVARRDQERPRWRLEASGGITRETIAAIAASGVDRISVGALTHSVRCLDVGLDTLVAVEPTT
jgi:nicotinate-nucleotide pyrophosphorylase (carboxylating)